MDFLAFLTMSSNPDNYEEIIDSLKLQYPEIVAEWEAKDFQGVLQYQILVGLRSQEDTEKILNIN